MKKIFNQFSLFNFERVIHSLKTVIACLIGFVVAHLLHVANEQWIIITIFVVMCAQSRIGALLQKSYMRFLGTLIGGAIAGFTILAFDSNMVATISVLCLAAFGFSYIAESPSTLSDAGTIGAVTVAIILLSPGQSLALAVTRFLEINIGIVIALIVSRFIWPIRSRTRLLHTIAATLTELYNFYTLLIQPEFIKAEMIDANYEEKIIGGLIKQRKLFEEVLREAFSPLPIVSEFKNILVCEREILRNISLMYHALRSVSEVTFCVLEQVDALHDLHNEVVDRFNQLIIFLQTKKKPELTIVRPANNWKEVIKNDIKINTIDILQVDTFLFCSERLMHRLNELRNEIEKLFVAEKIYDNNE